MSQQPEIEALRTRITLLFGRAVLIGVDDGGDRQLVQIEALKGELKGGVERAQQYGVTSNPLPKARVIFVSLAGNRDHPVVISIDDPAMRPPLSPGEVAIYTDEGDTIILKRGRNIEITTATLTVKASTKVRMETPVLECTGDVIDRVNGASLSMRGMRDVYNAHTHTETESVTLTPNQPMVGA